MKRHCEFRIANCGLYRLTCAFLNPQSAIRNSQLSNWFFVAVLFVINAAPIRADSLTLKPAPAWVAAAASRGRSVVVQTLSRPSVVAGVRGAAFRPDELYWMGTGADPARLVDAAERAEEAGRADEAFELYRKALTLGASGRTAARAAIGAGVMLLKAGRMDEATARLRIAASRADDPDLRFASTMPLATALAASARAAEGIAMLRELIAKYPDHPLAGQADGLAFMLEGK